MLFSKLKFWFTSKEVTVDSMVVVIPDLKYSCVFIAKNTKPRHVIAEIAIPHMIFTVMEPELLM